MGRLELIRVGLLEGLPLVCFVGLVGIVFGYEPLSWAALVPLVIWVGAGLGTAKLYLNEAREEGASPVAAVARGIAAPVTSLVATYRRLGLYRGRWLYDVATLIALLIGASWWVAVAKNDRMTASTVRWLSVIPLLVGPLGLWMRWQHRRATPRLLLDVMFALDSWQHRRRRAEFAYEAAIVTHLEQHGFDVLCGEKLENGREADIIVRPKGRAGTWDYRDIMIEMKAHLLKTSERDRAMGQLETYLSVWPGPIILMVCGEYRADLLEPLKNKVSALQRASRPVTIVTKGRQAT